MTAPHPTFSLEAEEALNAAALIDGAVVAQAEAIGLTPTAFFDRRNGSIWAALQTLRARGIACDIVAVFEVLRERGQDNDIGGLAYLNALALSVPNARGALVHASLILEKARQRRIEAIGKAIQQAVAEGMPNAALMARLEPLQRELLALTAPPQQDGRIKVEWARDLADDLKAPPQIVEGVLLAGGMSMMFGESNSGKSYLAIHLAICVSLGLPWLGRRTQRLAVLYVAAEGAWSIRTRLLANRKHYGHSCGTFGLIPAALSLLDPSADVDALIELIREKAAELGEPVGLIVIDTVARVMGGGDENAAVDMGRLVAAGDRIRHETGAHLLYIHHSGKDAARGARGHSSLRAALDTEIEVTADNASKTHTAKITKQRDLPSNGEQIAGRFVPVELGFDQWGNAITACAVVDAEVQPKASNQHRLSNAQQAVMGYLTGRESGARRRAIVDALAPQGLAQSSIYGAVKDLLFHAMLTEVNGVVYAPKV